MISLLLLAPKAPAATPPPNATPGNIPLVVRRVVSGPAYTYAGATMEGDFFDSTVLPVGVYTLEFDLEIGMVVQLQVFHICAVGVAVAENDILAVLEEAVYV
ncbi:UNVERIFIED_CONTAM: hypothetical protein HDU68_003798 [Siphonaria sp. JEL0065]|nr:hypothetical protein HDU68_003798 [Siphonaria sp. JEL0065]